MRRRAAPPAAGSPARSAPGLLPASVLMGCAAALSPAFALVIEEGTMTPFEARGGMVQGYVVRPEASGFYPGVVLIHEWWGLNEQIKGVADRLAAEGYVVIAPDLYRGRLGTDAGWARLLSRDLDEGWAVDVIGEAAGWLRAMDARRARRPPGERMPVAAFGMGMGGRLSLLAALAGKDIQGAIMFYGAVETDAARVRRLRVPLLGIFGEEDHGVPADQVKAFEAALKAEGKDATVLIYRAVGTAFFNEMRPGYEKAAAGMAWERTLEFLRQRLGGATAAAPPGREPRPAGAPSPGGGVRPND